MKKIEIKPNEITINEEGDLKIGDMILKIDSKEYLEQPKYKSIMEIGNVKANNIKHFNWIQKLFWSILLGIKIKDIKE